MSSDFINAIGANVPRLNQTNQVAPQQIVQSPGQTETGNKVADQTPAANFVRGPETGESLSEQKAGAAAASVFAGAWGGGAQVGGVAALSAGNLDIQGAGNTATNQVHGVGNGLYQASNGPKPGFTQPTTYTSRPPQT